MLDEIELMTKRKKDEGTTHCFATITKKGTGENKDENIMLLNPRTRSYEFRVKGNKMSKE